MAKMRIYSLLDVKTREFCPLALGQTDEAVKRQMREGFTGSTSTPERYPEDFQLYFLGMFDLESGRIEQENPVIVDSLATILGRSSRDVRAVSEEGTDA